jgi:UDP-2-acetamido-2-deoxy-ribo-hexuluronate aminotransferase
MSQKIEFIDLKTQYQVLKSSIDSRIQRVLDHGQYIMGPEVLEMESALANYVGAAHCISCASGTEALLMSLMALNIGPGDEVITVPFTYAATAEVIVRLGARPVFIDIERETCLMDVNKIEAAISPRTKAIMPVSLYGQIPDMDRINAIAAVHGNLPVIEDAAQSFGATYRGMKSCNLSTLGCTSFFPSKPLGCYGDGGAIFTSDTNLAQILREIRIHGQSRRYYHSRVGLAGRMDTIQCAIILAKLERFEWEVAQRIKLGHRYRSLIEQSGAPVKLLTIKPERECVWAQFTIFVEHRDIIQKKMKSLELPTAVHYPVSLNHQPAYSDKISSEATVNSHWVAERCMSLPMSPYLKEEDMMTITEALII